MDPSYKDERRMKKLLERMCAVADSDYGIPQSCPCGGRIIVETSKTESNLQSRYFTCNVFENDGLHRRKAWVDAVEDELSKLTKEVQNNSLTIARCEREMKKMHMELKKNAEEIAKLKEK